MEKLSTQNSVSILEKEYISLTEMINYLKSSFDFPYQSRFSLAPYADAMKANMEQACSYTVSALTPIIEQYMQFTESEEFSMEAMKDNPSFQAMVSLVIPSMIHNDQLNFISPPFVKEFRVSTPMFEEFFNGDKWEMKVQPEIVLSGSQNSLRELYVFILNKYYNQNISDSDSNVLIFRNKETGIERYYQLNINLDFVDVKLKGKLPELSQSDINSLLSNAEDPSLWMQTFPADLFEFYGFTMGALIDVTDIEILREVRTFIAGVEEEFDIAKFHDQIEIYIRSYLNKQGIFIGETIIDERNFHIDRALSLSGLSGKDFLSLHIKKNSSKGLYRDLLKEKRTVLCEDLSLVDSDSDIEKKILENGYKSLIIHPIIDKIGKIKNIIEFGSKDALAFNALTVSKLENIFTILDAGYLNFIDFLESQITNVVKEKFTAIHPSVEWKFEDAATLYFNNKLQGTEIDVPPIVFEDLYPLYGQSDIVSSSVIRSAAIQNDMIQNLELVSILMEKWLNKKQIHVLDAYHLKIGKALERIKLEFTSSDETDIVNLLVNDIHPLLHQLADRHSELSTKAYESYFSQLDSTYGIYYAERKSFEKSVSKLNNTIATFLEKEDNKLQSVQSHYFEKYKTDGVEYNMYVGQSLLQHEEFNEHDLQNFKMWQLTNMCEIVKLVDKLRPELPLPLYTAQLIFIYNHPLSIKFRMDEKKFDVDGSYNVRYEILKKRIDKAIIAETGERLTVAGKIAIVYLNETDKIEYLEYLQYLIDKGYISADIEDHKLENLQGADGLNALRVTVI